MAESRGMGRGLAAILPGNARQEDAEPGLRQIAVDLIRPNPDQPRKEFNGESLLALAESIEAKGLLQPLVVRALPGGTYELIAGERRLRASKIAKLEQVPAIIRDAEGSERLELALLENVAREDLNPVDEARACAILVDDLGVSKAELASRIGKSRPAVANAIRLLDLPDGVLELIERSELTGAHGRALLMTRDNDVFIPLGARVNIANAQHDAIFVCVHFNSASRRGANGIETYFYSTESAPLAGSIQSSVVRGAGTENRGVLGSRRAKHCRSPASLRATPSRVPDGRGYNRLPPGD